MNNNKKHKQINKQKSRIKKHNNKYTNIYTNTSKLFSLAYFTQKISGYCSDDIYKKDLHPLPPWHHN